MIGKIFWSVFPFYDAKNSWNAFKKRPVLVISGPRNNDYTVLPIFSVTKKQNLDSDYDFELDIKKYPLLNLTKNCYLGTHKQTIVHAASLTSMICDFKSAYPDLYIEALFPDYVFMETQTLERATIEALKKVNGFYHFLADNSVPQKLQGSDLTYYSNFRTNGEVMGISRARFDENQRIKIVDGPLLGFEGKIIRVNKRCQRVTVEIDILGDSKRVDLCYTDAQPL